MECASAAEGPDALGEDMDVFEMTRRFHETFRDKHTGLFSWLSDRM